MPKVRPTDARIAAFSPAHEEWQLFDRRTVTHNPAPGAPL